MEVVKGVESITGSIRSITDASVKQEVSIRRITQEINRISEVIQSNSATAEEIAAASEELSCQAQLLSGLAGRFRLGRSNAF